MNTDEHRWIFPRTREQSELYVRGLLNKQIDYRLGFSGKSSQKIPLTPFKKGGWVSPPSPKGAGGICILQAPMEMTVLIPRFLHRKELGGFFGLRPEACGLRSAFIVLCALLILGMVFAAQVSAGPVQYSEDKRFIDNGDSTITDTRTGYMWMKEDSYQYKGHWLSWFEASDYIEELNQERFADYLDWRLPTIAELTTLYEAEKFNSQQLGSEMRMHMDPIFAKEGSGTLWTSEANGNYNAFGVVFNHGQRFNSSKRKKARRAVRAIRNISP